MKRAFFVCAAVAAMASGCASTGTSTNAPASTPTSTPASTPASASAGYGFVVAPMAIVPPTGGNTNGWVPTALEADGRAGVRSDRFGRVERDRVVAENGQVLLQLSPDGTLSLPWNTAPTAPRFRLTAQGLETVNRGVTTLITVNDQGEYAENGTPSGARVSPYTPAHRDTALVLRVLHGLAFMHGMATANAAGNTAVTPAR